MEVLMNDVSDDASFDFGEGLASSVNVRARSVARSDRVPEEVVVAVAVDARTEGAQ